MTQAVVFVVIGVAAVVAVAVVVIALVPQLVTYESARNKGPILEFYMHDPNEAHRQRHPAALPLPL
eukprot:297208-Chlamydomonas_euryale.AAC.1